jgi:hypothetical protein
MAMSYQEARRIRETSLKDLILRNVDSGQGAIGAVGSALAERFNPSKRLAAKITGIKERLDPLNIAKKLTGNVGAALVGRALGRKQEDIRYFSGRGKLGSYRGITQDNDLDNLLPAMYTKVSEGQRQRMKKGESVTDVLAKLYNLTKIGYENEEKRRELDINFKFKEQKKREKQHKELIDAILSLNGGKKGTASKDKDKFDPLKHLKDLAGTAFKFIMKTLTSMVKGAIKGLKAIIKTAINAFKKVFGGIITKVKNLIKDGMIKIFEKLKSMASRAFNAVKELIVVLGGKVSNLARMLGLEKIAGSIDKAMEKSGEKIAIEEGEKIAEKEVEKEAEEQTAKAIEKEVGKEVAEVGIKEAEKVGAKSIGKSVLKKIPFLGAIAGLAFGAQRAAAGDMTGAALEVASGVVGSVPFVGTAASLGIDAYLAGRDLGLVGKEGGDTATPTGDDAPAVTPQTAVPYNLPSTGAAGGRGSASFAATDPRRLDLGSSGDTSTPQSSATSLPAEANPIGERAQASINQNNDLQMQDTKPKLINIDNSKNIMSGSGQSSGGVTIDDSVSVRIDDGTLQKMQKQNYRPV